MPPEIRSSRVRQTVATCVCDNRRVRSERFYTRASIAIGDAGLKAVGRLNVPLYRTSRGRLFGSIGGSPVLLITTTGRRSGQRRTAPVIYMADGERMIVIGSNAGNSRAPAWSLNLQADPSAEVQIGGRRRAVRARVAEGAEREDLWRRFADRYSGFDDYAKRTDRDIALFVLEPR